MKDLLTAATEVVQERMEILSKSKYLTADDFGGVKFERIVNRYNRNTDNNTKAHNLRYDWNKLVKLGFVVKGEQKNWRKDKRLTLWRLSDPADMVKARLAVAKSKQRKPRAKKVNIELRWPKYNFDFEPNRQPDFPWELLYGNVKYEYDENGRYRHGITHYGYPSTQYRYCQVWVDGVHVGGITWKPKWKYSYEVNYYRESERCYRFVGRREAGYRTKESYFKSLENVLKAIRRGKLKQES